MTTETSLIFYRFRGTKALLRDYQELARREIYFVAPEERNDPREGYADIVLTGEGKAAGAAHATFLMRRKGSTR